MAHDLKGDLGEEVTDDTLFSRSPTADRRYGPARRRDDPPDRRRFLVSVSFVTRLLQLYRGTGSVEPRPHGGGNPAVLTPEDLERLRELIRERPDATLEECRQHLGPRAAS